MAAAIDSLTSPTLKHLRERWWDDDFTEFLVETLRPRPGNRILDVGCGEGLAEVSIGRQHISQIRLVGVDLVFVEGGRRRVRRRPHTTARGLRRRRTRCQLPFSDGAFDSIYCVAVLQHVGDVDTAVAEFARVTRRGGRVVAVEPDNSARYAFSPADAGQRAFELCGEFFAAVAAARGDAAEPAVGPKLPALFARHGIEPIDVRLFPVSQARLGAPPAAVWADDAAPRSSARSTLAPFARAVARARLPECCSTAYEPEAAQAGPVVRRDPEHDAVRHGRTARRPVEGHEGWDEYAPFYDWENARTLGRRDVPFWRNLALQAGGPVLELGCGTGRISLPLGPRRRAAGRHRPVDADARSAPARASAAGRLTAAASSSCAATSASCRSRRWHACPAHRGRAIRHGHGAVRACCSRCCASAI